VGAEPSDSKPIPTEEKKRERRRAIHVSTGLYVFALLVSAGLWFVSYWGFFGSSKPIVYATSLTIILATTVLFAAAVIVRPDWGHPKELLQRFLRDDDWCPSLARLQLFAWTGLVLFAFTWITNIRILSGVPAFSGTFPPNLLGILTISTGSTVVASQIETTTPAPSAAVKKMQEWRALLDEVSSNRRDVHPSLARFQMLGWTIVSIGIYAVIIYVEVHKTWVSGSAAGLTLPDLDPTLLVLMGVSQSGYLGAKYVTYNGPQKSRVEQQVL